MKPFDFPLGSARGWAQGKRILCIWLVLLSFCATQVVMVMTSSQRSAWADEGPGGDSSDGGGGSDSGDSSGDGDGGSDSGGGGDAG